MGRWLFSARSVCRLLVAFSPLCCGPFMVRAAGPAPFMMSAVVDGKTVEGQPLAWNDHQMLLLGRDGILHEFHPDNAKQGRKTGSHFTSYTMGQMRSRLSREFGRAFEVSTTAHYVVVHPRGEWSAWADRLESLFRSFTRNMQIRGFSPVVPATPLVAAIFRSREDYYRHAAAQGSALPSGTLGHYDPKTNRIYLFDASGAKSARVAGMGASQSAHWPANSETIIHEATHQAAYNTGVHRRFAEQPRWLVEGLAMMYESRGVWDPRTIDLQTDRINEGRLRDFQAGLDTRPKDTLNVMIASDIIFRTNPAAAYAQAWAFSFYLMETRPREYCRLLQRVALRKAFSKYSAQKRLADFCGIFGEDLKLLDAQFLRFIAQLY
jgi:uncharacterized protein DUF1570